MRRFLALTCVGGAVLNGCSPANMFHTQPVGNQRANQRANQPTAQPVLAPEASALPAPTAAIQIPSPTRTGMPVTPALIAGTPLPPEVAGLRFVEHDRFLDRQGESVALSVELLNRAGEVITPNIQALPLVWSSSRQQDIEVNQAGQVTALVSSGFSIVVAKLGGSDLEARTVINVNDGSTGGGFIAPAGNARPVITRLQASTQTLTGAGQLVQLTATATDSDDTLTEASYSWRCNTDCNDFSATSGTRVFWRSPAISGNYVLQLTVTDGKNTVNKSVTLAVTTGVGNIVINP